MEFEIGKYIIRQYDKLNWIVMEKVKVDPNHHMVKKNATSTTKTRYKSKLVGYYSSLLHAKEELGERIALEVKSYEELCKWVKKLKSIK